MAVKLNYKQLREDIKDPDSVAMVEEVDDGYLFYFDDVENHGGACRLRQRAAEFLELLKPLLVVDRREVDIDDEHDVLSGRPAENLLGDLREQQDVEIPIEFR